MSQVGGDMCQQDAKVGILHAFAELETSPLHTYIPVCSNRDCYCTLVR